MTNSSRFILKSYARWTDELTVMFEFVKQWLAPFSEILNAALHWHVFAGVFTELFVSSDNPAVLMYRNGSELKPTHMPICLSVHLKSSFIMLILLY